MSLDLLVRFFHILMYQTLISDIMKNLFLATALVLSLSANAASTIGKSNITVLAYQEKEYKKVETTQVPADILKSASTRYSGFALSEASASEDGEYRLVL